MKNLLSLFKSSQPENTDTHEPPPPPIIGLEVVGRGINLRPHQAYELKKVLFSRQNCCRTFHSKETGQTYLVPYGYEANESPPMPASQTINQTLIEDSWEHFDNHFNLDTHAACSNTVFSLDVKMAQTKSLRSEHDTYYAARTFFIPYWTLYLSDVTKVSEKESFDTKIPTPYNPDNRLDYEKFFERYGTHYIKRAWIGGKATLTFTVPKSQMSKQEFRQHLNTINYTMVNDNEDNYLKETRQNLQKHSECLVLGQGGQHSQLAALTSLDETSYNQWLATLKENPKVVELEAVGIWTLINDKKKATALRDAYEAATTFTPLSAIISYDNKVYFLRANTFTCYHPTHNTTEKPKPISDLWPCLQEQDGFEMIEAALEGQYLKSLTGEDLNRKLFFFSKDKYIRWDIDNNQMDDDYPKRITKGWPGIPFEKIDAALNAGPDYVYFFKGDQYVRYNIAKNKVDSGYPQPTKKRWAGLTFDRIDGAIAWGNGKAYFFRADEHIRYDMTEYRTDPGYPKSIVGSYAEDWKFFD